MAPAALERLAPDLQPVSLTNGQVVCHVDVPVEHVFFVNVGFVSLIKTMEDGRSVEIGGVGVDGVTSPSALFGVDGAIFEALVQVPGSAFRIRRNILKHEMEHNPPLRDLIEGYLHHTLAEIGQTAACNRLHSVEQRCCRWLLIAQDNALSERFALTHEFLAMMLGVQRPSVSVALKSVKHAGLIAYSRWAMTILDRPSLLEHACECYRTSRARLDQLFGRGEPGGIGGEAGRA